MCDILLSTFAFNFNLRRYRKVPELTTILRQLHQLSKVG